MYRSSSSNKVVRGSLHFGSWPQINTFHLQSHHVPFRVTPPWGLDRQAVLLLSAATHTLPAPCYLSDRAQTQKEPSSCHPRKAALSPDTPYRQAAMGFPSAGRSDGSVCRVRGRASAAREDNWLATTPKAENKNEALQHTLSFSQHLLKGTDSMGTGRVLHGQGGVHEQH